MRADLLASIPSPSTSTVSLGPLTVHMYGLTLLVAIAACVWLTGVRWTRRGGDWDLVFRCAVWGVAAGVVGARLYHVLTSWNEVPEPKWKGAFEVWQGGLGVWGGIGLGVVVGAIVVHRSGESVTRMMDAVAPGLLLAQAIGRIGNWWNQELFGKPTDLPWGLEIDPVHRPIEYLASKTFHPTFLYELIWDLVGVGVLLVVDRRFRIRPPALFALYVSWYTLGRTFEELLRVDPSHEIAGQRLNFWVSLVVFVVATAFFVWWQFFNERGGDRAERPPGGGRRRWRLPFGRRRRAAEPKRPAMTIPKSRVRHGR
jgi:prolipoprotein diacylglyceryl transferase